MAKARKLQPEDILFRVPAVQHAALGSEGVVLRHRAGLTLLDGLRSEDVEKVLGQVDGRRDAATICHRLATELPPPATRRILRGLLGEALLHHPVPELPVAAVDGEGDSSQLSLQQVAADTVAAAPITADTATTDSVTTDTVTTDTVAADEKETSKVGVLGNGPVALRLLALLQGRSLEPPFSPAEFKGIDLAIAIGEALPYHQLLEFQRSTLAARIPSLFVTVDGDGIRYGPSSIPGLSACFGCAQLAALGRLGGSAQELLASARGFRTAEAPHSTPLVRRVTNEVREFLASEGNPRWTSEIQLERWDGSQQTLSAPRRADCPLCSDQPPPMDHPLTRRLERRAIAIQERSPRRTSPAAEAPLVRTVGILGGGTAGYLAALALRRHHPELAVTVIESSRVPVIGVGEATTPLMPQFLHVDLGFDIHHFFRRVEPTLKLGIRFAWGPKREHTFNYPFGPNRVLEAMVWDGHLSHASLQGMLMDAGAVPLESPALQTGSSVPTRSYLGSEIAYHLDNQRFVSYLKEQAEAFGVHQVDAQVVDVEVDESGEEVRSLLAEEGRRFSFDFYLDCSGFRSLLLGKALGSSFQGYEASLFTDRAVVATAPHGGSVAPHTLARAMDAGWCWSTPQRREDHRGYVFSSAFLSDEEAIAEMRRKNPGLGDPRFVHFRPGRRHHFMKGNVIALGNSYGFVEPLESTALHMLIRQIGLLLRAFPLRRGERGLAATLNRKVAASWDYLRWFLALHFRFNQAYNTPFWNHCRTAVDVSAHAELLAAFNERGPLSFDPILSTSFDYPDPLWGPEGIDVILLGQGVPTRLPIPALEKTGWRAHVLRCQRVVERSISQAEALRHLDRSPELLQAFADAFRRTGPAFGSSPR